MQNNSDLIDQYLVWLSDNKGRSDATIGKYRGYILRLVDFLDGDSLLEVNPQRLEVFAGPAAVKAGLSGRSRRAMIAAIRGFYKWAEQQGDISNNPAETLPYPKMPEGMPVPISLANAERLTWAPDLSTFLGLRDATMFAVLMGCGLRVSGLTRLNEESLSVVNNNGQTRLLLRVREKGGKERIVPVPREAQLMLQAYLGHQELEEIDRRTPDGGKVLFVTINNRNIAQADYVGEARRMKPAGVWKRIRHYGSKLDIPEEQLRPHAMRHLYGTELAEDNVDLLERQALLGHADPKSTEVYTHLAARKLLDTVDRANPLSKMSTPVTKLLEDIT